MFNLLAPLVLWDFLWLCQVVCEKWEEPQVVGRLSWDWIRGRSRMLKG